MNTKKFILAALVSFVVMYLLSMLWYSVIMNGFYSENFAEVQRAEFNMIWVTFGYILYALLLAFIYPKGYSGGIPLNEGLRFGFLMGLLIAVPLGLVYQGVWKITLSGNIVDMIYQVVEKSIAGAFIGLIYGKGVK